MKHLKKAVVFLMGVLILSSCSTSDEPQSLPENKDKMNVENKLIVKYNGNCYETDVLTLGDTTIYLNEDVAALYENVLSKIPQTAIMWRKLDNGMDMVEYFNSDKELKKRAKLTYLNQEELTEVGVETRSGTSFPMPGEHLGRAVLFDDKNFGHPFVEVFATETQFTAIPNLKSAAGFNDKASAIKLYNFMKPGSYYNSNPYSSSSKTYSGSNLRTCLVGFHNSDYKGIKLYCISKPSVNETPGLEDSNANHFDYNLRKIGWNDKISSIVFRIIKVELIEGEISYIGPNPNDNNGDPYSYHDPC